MTMQRILLLVLAAVGLLALPIFRLHVSAQTEHTYSVEDLPVADRYVTSPRILVDPYGTVHVFYAAWPDFGNEPAREDHNTIMYTFGTSGHWSTPLDILVPADKNVGGVGVNTVLYNPTNDRLYVLWRSDSGLYLSTAPRGSANTARAWQTQTIVTATTYWASMARSQVDGSLHLVYDSDLQSINHMSSLDEGKSWDLPSHIVEAPGDEVAYSGSRILIDSRGHLHIVWDENASYREWAPDAVWYARSIDNGESWEVTEVARSTPGEASTGGINMGFGNGNDLFTVWNRGAGSDDGRYFRISRDGGETWSDAQEIWPNSASLKGGQAGWNFPLLDGNGSLYLVTSIEDEQVRSEGVSNSLRIANWTGQNWGPSWYLTTCEFPDATVSQANLIHVVCRTLDGTEVVKYVRIQTDARSAQPLPTPTLLPSNSESITRTEQAVEDGSPSSTRADAAETLESSPLSVSVRRAPRPGNPVSTLLAGVLASLTIMFPVLVFRLRKR